MIGRSPIYVLSMSRNYGGLIPLTALQITITKKSKNFSRDSGILFQWSGILCAECAKRELFGSSACNHDYEGHPLLVCKSGDWDSHCTILAIGFMFGQLSKKVSNFS